MIKYLTKISLIILIGTGLCSCGGTGASSSNGNSIPTPTPSPTPTLPTSQYAYVLNGGDSTVTSYKVSESGSLTLSKVSPVKESASMAIPSSGYYALLGGNNQISSYALINGGLIPKSTLKLNNYGIVDLISISQYGKLAVVGVFAPAYGMPFIVAISESGSIDFKTTLDINFLQDSYNIAMAPSGDFVLAYLSSGSMNIYTLNSLGFISHQGSLSGLPTPNQTPDPHLIAISQAGTRAFVTNEDYGTSAIPNYVNFFTVSITNNESLALESVTRFAANLPIPSSSSFGVAISPAGDYGYSLGQINNYEWCLFSYSISNSGVLSFIESIALPIAPGATNSNYPLVISADGAYGYIPNVDNNVLEYGINSGLFSPLAESTIQTGKDPIGMGLGISVEY